MRNPFKEKNPETVQVNTSDGASLEEVEAPKEVQTTIPFKKAWELFFSRESPPKETRPEFFFWYPKEMSQKERWVVFKIDVSIMTYVCLSYFTRYLDAANVASAYVSGMKEDLNITGEQYVWLTQIFNASYCFAGFVSTIILTKVRFSRMLPFLEVAWALFCLFIYKANSFKTIAVLRFFQGLCEGTAWPAIHYILGSWYTPKELGKRTAIFISSGNVGTLLSGVIQAALKSTMDGKNGLAGWRWLFIIDAIITFPIAVLGLFVPDTPRDSRPRLFITEEDLEIARARVRIDGRERVSRLDWSTFKRVLTSYQWYLFVIAWTIWTCASSINSYFNVVLKALGYSVYNRNNIPASLNGFGIFCCLTTGFLVDIIGRRIDCALVCQGIWVIGAIIIKVYEVGNAGIIVGYILLGAVSAISPLIVGWCNELCKEDNQLRATTIGCLNFVGGLLSIPYNTGLFNTDWAPRYSKGTTANLIMCVLLFFYFFVILAFDRYQRRKRAYIRQMYQAEKTTIDGVEPYSSVEEAIKSDGKPRSDVKV